MQINIGSLTKHTVLYLHFDDTCPDTSPSFKNFFKHCLNINNLNDAKRIFEKVAKNIDIIYLESSTLKEEEIEILNFIRSINNKVPILFITNEINNEILILSREYNIGSFLLRPFKVQELCKLSVVKINKYKKRLHNKDSLRVLSKQIQALKEEKKELSKSRTETKDLLSFYIQFQENYLQFVKIDKQGIVKFISKELEKELDSSLKNKTFIQLFDEPQKVQNALILSMKDRRINTVKNVILKNFNQKEWTINILPSFENEKELYSYNIFFHMTK